MSETSSCIVFFEGHPLNLGGESSSLKFRGYWLTRHFVLVEVCSVDILVACLRISTGFEGDSFRETHL